MTRSRARRILKWACTLATGALAVLTCLTLCWGFGVVHRGWSIGFGNAVFSLAHVPSWDVAWLVNLDGPRTPTGIRGMMWLPNAGPFYGPGGGWIANLPLWIPLAALALLTTWLWRGDRRFVPPGCCRTCKYDLTGNTTGICPECGQPAEPSA